MSSVPWGKDPNAANFKRKKLAFIMYNRDTKTYGGKALGLHLICQGNVCESTWGIISWKYRETLEQCEEVD